MKIANWILIIVAVAIAAGADSVSTLWANNENKVSWYLLALIIISPVVFIAFGMVTTRVGLAMTSAIVNSLLVLTSIMIGLFIFGDWSKISILQYCGMSLSLVGIFLMLFFPKI